MKAGGSQAAARPGHLHGQGVPRGKHRLPLPGRVAKGLDGQVGRLEHAPDPVGQLAGERPYEDEVDVAPLVRVPAGEGAVEVDLRVAR